MELSCGAHSIEKLQKKVQQQHLFLVRVSLSPLVVEKNVALHNRMQQLIMSLISPVFDKSYGKGLVTCSFALVQLCNGSVSPPGVPPHSFGTTALDSPSNELSVVLFILQIVVPIKIVHI